MSHTNKRTHKHSHPTIPTTHARARAFLIVTVTAAITFIISPVAEDISVLLLGFIMITLIMAYNMTIAIITSMAIAVLLKFTFRLFSDQRQSTPTTVFQVKRILNHMDVIKH